MRIRSKFLVGAAIFAAAAMPSRWAPDAPVRAQAAAGIDPALFSGLRWRSAGPARGGRAIAATVAPNP